MIGLVVLVADRRDGARGAAARRRVRAAGDQRDRQPALGDAVASSRRSAPTTSGAACGRSSSGARGSACSSASRRPCIAIVIGSVVGIVAGLLRRLARRRADAAHRVVPRDPVPAARDRAGRVLGPSVWNIILVIGITSWPVTARVIRAQVLTLKERLYVDRSRALGASNGHLMSRHILPNVSPLILANTTLTVPSRSSPRRRSRSSGSATRPRASWGKMLDEAFSAGARDRATRGGTTCRPASGSWSSCSPSS